MLIVLIQKENRKIAISAKTHQFFFSLSINIESLNLELSLDIFKHLAIKSGMQNPFRKLYIPGKDILLDTAFSSASRTAGRLDFKVRRTSYGTTRMKPVEEIASQKEGTRISTASNSFYNRLKKCTQTFPIRRDIPMIYQQFADELVGLDQIFDSISFINKKANYVKKLQGMYLDKLTKVRHTNQMRRTRQEFFGRVVGEAKKLERHLLFLGKAFATLRNLPDLKDSPTVVIAGYPNVGKTSLLAAITGSKPEVKAYPFTTKGLMIGYIPHKYDYIQFIDTPGVLGRKKANPIEVHAEIALHKIADVVVYVFDLSETCGYSLEDQLKLYKRIKKLDKPMISIVNKIDVLGIPKPEEITKKVKSILVSCDSGKGIDELTASIKKLIK
jgi:nucleolar GTP-binding protein